MVRSLATLLASLLVAGCYFGPIEDGSYRSPETRPVCGNGTCQAAESCSSCPEDCGVCVADWDIDLGSGALEVTGSTRNRSDALGVACGDGGYAPDLSYRWTAPTSGTYLFSLFDETFDAVLDVRSQTSTGPEVACVATSSGLRSVAVTLGARQSVVVIVDGARGQSGSFRLAIEPAAPYCGDGTCSAGEDSWSCATDCASAPTCGDGYCDAGEDGWGCPEDCDVCEGYCGDGFCGGGEDGWNCYADCDSTCGNGTCDLNEDGYSCATDCTSFCGDAFCDPTETAWGCAADCSLDCGDGTCGHGEDSWNCSWDCGVVCPG
ncbi:MAG: hypothetical protein HY901_38685 [Deltaproteobacteria bacterium]|nr:hypothetical protein [Deltaproteobacteria bacterium]